MPMPFASLGRRVLAAFGRVGSITVTTYPAGAYDPSTGDWTRAAGTDALIEAAVMPSSPRELQELPEGEQTKEAITLFTTKVLRPAFIAGATESDVVTWNGLKWKVVLSEDWTLQAQYARAIATRIGA